MKCVLRAKVLSVKKYRNDANGRDGLIITVFDNDGGQLQLFTYKDTIVLNQHNLKQLDEYNFNCNIGKQGKDKNGNIQNGFYLNLDSFSK